MARVLASGTKSPLDEARNRKTEEIAGKKFSYLPKFINEFLRCQITEFNSSANTEFRFSDQYDVHFDSRTVAQNEI